MKLKFDYDFLLLEFKDLHHIIKRVEEEDDIKLLCTKLLKIIQHIVIIVYLSNNRFYNSEISLVENIRYLLSKDILQCDIVEKLLLLIEELNGYLDKDNSEMRNMLIDKENIIYEFLVYLVTNCGEEDYSLFYDKLNSNEKYLFKKYLSGISNGEDDSNFESQNIEVLRESEQKDIDEEEFDNMENNLLAGEMYYLGKGVNKNYFKAKEFFEIAAEEGSEYAEGYLGLFFEKGYGGEKDIKKALYWYKKAALKENVFAQYSLGYIYFAGEVVEKNMEYSFQWYKKAAENNFAPAQYALSYLYKNGEGCEKNIFKAYYWLEESAENDFEEAYYILGQSYLEGNYMGTDYKKAFFYLSKGEERGDLNCIESLGDMYYWGFYVKQDKDKAFELYKKSIDGGNINLYYKVGKLYEEDGNKKMALSNYLKGHNNGDLKSTQKLGIIYYNGDGVTKDRKKALEYMNLAADEGDAHALYVIGMAFINESRNEGIEYLKKAYKKGSEYAAEALASELLIDVFNEKEIDTEELLMYIEKAMECELEEAIYYYGLVYSYGIGVTQNNEEAFKYFISAADKGSEKAMIKLGNWYKHGIFVNSNIKEAINWYKKAAKEYNTEALLHILEIYEKGIGIEKNYNKAFEGAKLLRETNLVEGNLKLAYYYILGIGTEKDFEQAQKYIDESLLLDEGKTLNFLGELAVSGLFNLEEEEAIEYYLKAIDLGSVKAYSNLEYYLYNKNDDISRYKETLDNIRKLGYWIEQGKSVYIKGMKLMKEGQSKKNEEIIEQGLKELKKSLQLGFYESVKEIVKYYESKEPTPKNLSKLYKYKEKQIYYNI